MPCKQIFVVHFLTGLNQKMNSVYEINIFLKEIINITPNKFVIIEVRLVIKSCLGHHTS